MRNIIRDIVHGLADLIADAITSKIKDDMNCSPTEAVERFQHSLADLFPVKPEPAPSPPPAPAKRTSARGRIRNVSEIGITPEMIQAQFYEVNGRVFYRHKTKAGKRADTEAGNISKSSNGKTRQCVIYIESVRFPRSHIVFCLHNNRFPNHKIVHVNFDRLDDRIENIVEATQAEICRTSRVSKRNVIGVKGVAYDTSSPNYPYRSRITRHGICLRLGSYATASEAHEAYCNAANKLHGNFNPSSNLYQSHEEPDAEIFDNC